jgi:hemoglobin
MLFDDSTHERRFMVNTSLSSFKHIAVSIVFISTMVTSGLLLATSLPLMAQSGEKSLYQRVGGYDALAAVVDDFIGRLVSDKQFEKFFSGFSIDSKKRIRQHLLDQLCVATGGPCVYLGRDMKTTHGGLRITEADWDTAVKHLTTSIDKFKVPNKEKGELLAFVASLKKDIVEQ